MKYVTSTVSGISKTKAMYCKYCPMQYYAYTFGRAPPSESKVVEVKAWYNLGAGQSPKDSKWLHIARTGKEKRAFAWGKQNIAEAFERIWCSTEEEFKRQLERSDERGNWYEPELERKAYKSLPVHLAGRL